MFAGDNHLLTKIEVGDFEKKIIIKLTIINNPTICNKIACIYLPHNLVLLNRNALSELYSIFSKNENTSSSV